MPNKIVDAGDVPDSFKKLIDAERDVTIAAGTERFFPDIALEPNEAEAPQQPISTTKRSGNSRKAKPKKSA